MADNSSFNYSVGLHNVGSYRVSGDPWVSGSDSQAANEEVCYQFPWVAKRVTIYNYSARVLRVHFNATGSSGDVVGGLTIFFEQILRDDIYLFVRALCGKNGGDH